jgi:hypothetical protein
MVTGVEYQARELTSSPKTGSVSKLEYELMTSSSKTRPIEMLGFLLSGL